MENFGDLLADLLDNAAGPNAFDDVMNDVAIQFGPEEQPYVMATVLPERPVDSEDVVNDSSLRVQSIIANATDRFSPPQYKSLVEGVSIGAKLADSNSGIKFEATNIGAINRMLRRNDTVRAQSTIMRGFERGTVKPLLDLAELWRVQCLVNAQIIAVGMNGRSEQINYINPANARSNALGTWSDNAYDPMPDIMAKVKYLKDRGYRVARIITDSNTVRILAGNAKMIARATAIKVVDTAGVNGTTLTGLALSTRLSIAQLNGVLASEELPALEVYDGVYNTSTVKGVFFFPRNTMLFVGATAEAEDIIDTQGNLLTTLTNTLGFTGVGIVVNQQAPGRVYQAKYEEMIPQSLVMHGWQTLIPVLLQDDAVAVIKNIA